MGHKKSNQTKTNFIISPLNKIFERKIMSIKLSIFSYPSVLTFVLGAPKNHRIETVCMFWLRNIKINFSLYTLILFVCFVWFETRTHGPSVSIQALYHWAPIHSYRKAWPILLYEHLISCQSLSLILLLIWLHRMDQNSVDTEPADLDLHRFQKKI